MLLLIACEEPEVEEDPPPAPGATGGVGPAGCRTEAGETLGLQAAVTITPPQNNQYYVPGEQATVTIVFTDRCDSVIRAADLRTADLFLYGPRKGSLTTTAAKLLNCSTERPIPSYVQVEDLEQHHFVSLLRPVYADPSQANKAESEDGTITYRLAPFSDEVPGTYTVSVWARSRDYRDQIFTQLDMQVGTPEVEEYATGSIGQSTCLACHNGTRSFKTHGAHSRVKGGNPFPSPIGNFAVDQGPIGSCKACHNNNGLSTETLVRKVHGVHRGTHLTNPGVAHPEYGAAADASMKQYSDVLYPAMPDHEMDCSTCHVGQEWNTSPSRLACGSCHDNVFFDTGVLQPPRDFGQIPPSLPGCPGTAGGSQPHCACNTDSDCSFFGTSSGAGSVVCANPGPNGTCQRQTHPAVTDDTVCINCHSAGADNTGTSPTVEKHKVLLKELPGMQINNIRIAHSASDANQESYFLPGDRPVITFQLTDGAGVPRTLTTHNILIAVGGPTDAYQRVDFSLPPRSSPGEVSHDENGNYSVVLLALPAFPLKPAEPVNYDKAKQIWLQNPIAMDWIAKTNPAARGGQGFTFTVLINIDKKENPKRNQVPTETHDGTMATVDFVFGGPGKIQARNLVMKEACLACHNKIYFMQGSRQDTIIGCTMCHSEGALDRGVGGRGATCLSDSDCTSSFERCLDGRYPAAPLALTAGTGTVYTYYTDTPWTTAPNTSSAGWEDADPPYNPGGTASPQGAKAPSGWPSGALPYPPFILNNTGPSGTTGGTGPAKSGSCAITKDPTPNVSLFMRSMIHNIHFSRLREGYAERGNMVEPAVTWLKGGRAEDAQHVLSAAMDKTKFTIAMSRSPDNRNVLEKFSVLYPMDMRNCTNCHFDSQQPCDENTPCGIGQECLNRICRNNAWRGYPQTVVCTACHDSEATAGHAALQTWTNPADGSSVETCAVCHTGTSAFSVDIVHNIANPYVAPLEREPASKQ